MELTADSIPGYEILRELNRGGQGIVYQAIQQQTKRKVAIKVRHGGRPGSTAAGRRFEREIELVGQLRHPGIISIFHSGATIAGQQFYVMDYIRGLPISRFVRENGLSMEEALAVFAQVCEAVQYAHQRGIIHRDLKPSNILVDSDKNPRVLDFGLARLLAQPLEAELTVSHEMIGTVRYMSPEQTRGNPDEIDTRTDVYSLGVVLYELLTGGFPYPVDGEPIEILRHITTTPPAPPTRTWTPKDGITTKSARRPRSGQCPIDTDVETIVLRSLSKERSRRYQSAGELARDIGHYLVGNPIEARKDSGWYVFRKALQRNKVAVAACFVVVIVVASIGLSLLYAEAVHQRDLAYLAGRETHKLLIESYAQTARAALRHGDWSIALESLDRALSAEHPEELAMRLGKVEAWIWLNESERAIAELERLRQRSDLGRHRGPVLLWSADVALMQSLNWLEAIDLIEEALEIGLPPDDEAYARGLVAEGTVSAVAHFNRALRINFYHHQARNMLAMTLFLLGHLDDARVHLEISSLLRPDDVGPKAFLAVLYSCQHDLEAGHRLLDEIEPRLGAELTDIFRESLTFLGEVNRVGTGGYDDGDSNELLKSAMRVAGRLIPYYRKMSRSNANAQQPADLLTFGLRLPPFLARGLGGAMGATTLMIVGNVDGALRELEDVVEAHPEGMMLLLYGALLRDNGRLAEAEAAFRKAGEAGWLFDWRRLALWQAAGAQWLLATADGDAPNLEMKARAIQSIRDLVRLGDLSPTMASTSATVAIEAGEFDLARTILGDWQRRDPDDVRALRLRAAAEFGAGAFGPAIAAAEAVLAREPGDTKMIQIRDEALQRLR